jgi:hypothetical protein
MKRLVCAAACLLVAGMGFAQTDTTSKNVDTVKVGNFIIIKKKNGGSTPPPLRMTTITTTAAAVTNTASNANRAAAVTSAPTGGSSISAFANWRDKTDYAAANATGGFYKTIRRCRPVNENSNKLITGKSSNVNIWLFIQKLNLIKHVVNLKYGLGLEMYNFRFDNDISFRKDPAPYAFNDSVTFTKNKLVRRIPNRTHHAQFQYHA